MRLVVSESIVDKSNGETRGKVSDIKSCFELCKISIKEYVYDNKHCIRCNICNSITKGYIEIYGESYLVNELFNKLVCDGWADISNDSRYICMFRDWED